MYPADHAGIILASPELDDHTTPLGQLPRQMLRDRESHRRSGQRKNHIGIQPLVWYGIAHGRMSELILQR